MSNYYNKYQKGNRMAVIDLVDHEYLQCTFYEDEKIVGAIEYFDKAYNYVRDAAENWIEGIMTHETVKNYTKQLDLFSK